MGALYDGGLHEGGPLLWSRPYPRDTIVLYQMRGTKMQRVGKVVNAGYYVLLVIDEQGGHSFIFYDEIIAVNPDIPNGNCSGGIAEADRMRIQQQKNA